MLTAQDIRQIKSHGLTIEKVYRQLEKFSLGIPYAKIVTAASVGNGIEVITRTDRSKLIEFYDKRKEELDIVKFVPASGAATRMFKFLHNFLDEYDPDQESLNAYLKKKNDRHLNTFFSNMKHFPFINQVRNCIREKYPDYKQSDKGTRSRYFVKCMLEEDGLNFNALPKGLIPFHKYTKNASTAFEEQLYESSYYASSKGEAYLHFTFTEHHVPFFKQEFDSIIKRVTKRTKTKFHVTYSFQKKETDTIAVKKDNYPFRNRSGKLVFRPSGHGALLENLNEVDADVIFIKNIDNVIVNEYVPEVADFKKLLGGKLLWLQRKIFNYLESLENGKISEDLYKEIKSFMWNELNIKDIPVDLDKLRDVLNRPLRVCGVVRNTGAPGGGPFWVENEAEEVNLQIVETAQVDMNDSHQKAIVNESTHFNPVDIVCGIRNYKGKKFDLKQYHDPGAGFISEKSEAGSFIKALERPGLWNGSMAKWNTVFVEVPLITFNPVKTVNDLLNKEHRPNA